MIGLPLKEEAHKIVKDLIETELYKQHLYMYLSLCASNVGFYDARRWFYEKSNDQSCSVRNLLSMLEKRGIKEPLPSVDQITGDYSSLKAAFQEAYDCEVESIVELQKAVRKLLDIDVLAFSELLNFLSSNKWSIERLHDLINVFSAAESKEDELELESKEFGCHDNAPVTQG